MADWFSDVMGASPEAPPRKIQRLDPSQGEIGADWFGEIGDTPAGDIEFSARASAMSPVDISLARGKNDKFGAWLREQAKKPKDGENERQRFKRLYGSLDAERPGVVEGVARSYLQGGLAGAGDEAIAFAQSQYKGGPYEYYLNRERNKLDMFREDRPVTAFASELGGGIPTFAATGGPGKALTTGGAALKSGLIGLGQGGVYGFNAGEGEGRLPSALFSAAAGGALGYALPYAGEGIKNIYRTGRDALNASRAGMSRPAYNLLDDAVRAEGARGYSFKDSDAMLADAGDTLSGMLDYIASRGQEGGRIAKQAVKGRVSKSSKDIVSALDESLGKPQAYKTFEKNPAVSDLYKKAYDAPVPYDTPAGYEIEELVKRIPAQAVNYAKTLMKMGGHESRQILADIADDGTVTFRELPDVVQLDYLTRGLNQMAKGSEGMGATGGKTDIGSFAANLSSDIRSLLKRSVPKYKDALAAAADDIRMYEAFDFGGDVLRGNIKRGQAARTLKGMGKAELEQVRGGARQYIDDLLANVKEIRSGDDMEARQAFAAFANVTTPASAEKLKMLLGKKAAFELRTKLLNAKKAFELRSRISTNSKTAPREMYDARVTASREGPIMQARQGRAVDATRQAVASIMGASAKDLADIDDKIIAEVAKALTDKDPQKVLRLLGQSKVSTLPRYGRAVESGLRGAIPAAGPGILNYSN